MTINRYLFFKNQYLFAKQSSLIVVVILVIKLNVNEKADFL
ncbi:hypothetical protein SAMN04488101_113103 [Pedobacter nyackensis]|uniref:Uncharacterized protein n=1 Tax=Pedobacter nyackensis TaxID=475255 RepID=A0A1W2ELA6_9SPHI|nr:hypothetical protein SAMN04488101_113103 [Pedobacter nyackensis]